MTITDDIRAIATVFLVIGLVLEGYLLWKRKNSRAVNDSSQPTRDKQGGRWATLGIHFFSFVSVSFFIYFEVTESMRGEFEGITFEGETCLSEEVDPISGYSRKEVCELSVQFFDALNSQDVNIITAYLFPFVAENIVITINPRGLIPEFMVPTCTVGEDEAKEKIYEAFEIMGATIEYAEVNATTTSDISVYMRTFLLGITMHTHVEMTMIDRKCSAFMMGCCDRDSYPEPLDTCVAESRRGLLEVPDSKIEYLLRGSYE